MSASERERDTGFQADDALIDDAELAQAAGGMSLDDLKRIRPNVTGSVTNNGAQTVVENGKVLKGPEAPVFSKGFPFA